MPDEPRMTKEEREELLALCEKATREPWIFRTTHEGDDPIEDIVAEIGCAATDEDPEYGTVLVGADFPEIEISNNWEFIAVARTALPRALRELEESETTLIELTKEWKFIGDQTKAVTEENVALSQQAKELAKALEDIESEIAKADKIRFRPDSTGHNWLSCILCHCGEFKDDPEEIYDPHELTCPLNAFRGIRAIKSAALARYRAAQAGKTEGVSA